MQFTVTGNSLEELKEALTQLTGTQAHECKCKVEQETEEKPKPKRRTRKKKDAVDSEDELMSKNENATSDSKAGAEAEEDPRPEEVMSFLLMQKNLTDTMSEYKGDLIPTQVLVEQNTRYGVPGAKQVKETDRRKYINEFRAALGLEAIDG